MAISSSPICLSGPIAVRLEHDQQAAGEGVQRRERGGDLVRVVPEIVDHGDAARRADRFEPALEAGEAAPAPRAASASGSAAGPRRGDRGERIGDIVAAGHLEPHVDRRAASRAR